MLFVFMDPMRIQSTESCFDAMNEGGIYELTEKSEPLGQDWSFLKWPVYLNQKAAGRCGNSNHARKSGHALNLLVQT